MLSQIIQFHESLVQHLVHVEILLFGMGKFFYWKVKNASISRTQVIMTVSRLDYVNNQACNTFKPFFTA